MNNEVGIKSPGGWMGWIKGREVAWVIMLGLFVALGFYHDRETQRHYTGILQELQVQTCILSTTLDERKQIREDMKHYAPPQVRQALVLWCPWLRANADRTAKP